MTRVWKLCVLNVPIALGARRHEIPSGRKRYDLIRHILEHQGRRMYLKRESQSIDFMNIEAEPPIRQLQSRPG